MDTQYLSQKHGSDGLKNFSDEMIADVYATPLANPEANWIEIFLYSIVGFLDKNDLKLKD